MLPSLLMVDHLNHVTFNSRATGKWHPDNGEPSEDALLCAQLADDANPIATIVINKYQSIQLAFITTD